MIKCPIFLSVKFNDYSKHAKIISMAFQNNAISNNKVLYLENSDYDLNDNTGWIPGDSAVANRLLENGTPVLFDNVVAKFIPLSEFTTEIELFLNNYSNIRLVVKDPIESLLFFNLYGSIDNIPNRIDPTPIFLPSLLFAKGYDTDVNYNSLIDNVYNSLPYNALSDVGLNYFVFNKIYSNQIHNRR